MAVSVILTYLAITVPALVSTPGVEYDVVLSAYMVQVLLSAEVSILYFIPRPEGR